MNKKQLEHWLANKHTTPLSTYINPLVMGVLNVTDDSFSDGNAYLALDKASCGRELIAQHVDIIDIVVSQPDLMRKEYP